MMGRQRAFFFAFLLSSLPLSGCGMFARPPGRIVNAPSKAADDSCEEYVGETKSGKRHGQGKCTYDDGDTYVGEWKDGKRNGQGTYTSGKLQCDADKESRWFPYTIGTYVGEWKDDKQNGQGTCTVKIRKHVRCTYVGEWKDGKRNGQGTSTGGGKKYDVTYVGEWKDDKQDGQGTSTGDGEQYVGEWRDGMRHGQGKCTYDDGNTYVGEWKGDKQNGQGTGVWVWSNSDENFKYVGEWRDGYPSGQGTGTWASGVSFTGLFDGLDPVQNHGVESFSSEKHTTPAAMYIFAAQLEENHNRFPSKVIYREITRKFPDAPEAVKAADRLLALANRDRDDQASRAAAGRELNQIVRDIDEKQRDHQSCMAVCAGYPSDCTGFLCTPPRTLCERKCP